jgi:hypothetical protein
MTSRATSGARRTLAAASGCVCCLEPAIKVRLPPRAGDQGAVAVAVSYVVVRLLSLQQQHLHPDRRMSSSDRAMIATSPSPGRCRRAAEVSRRRDPGARRWPMHEERRTPRGMVLRYGAANERLDDAPALSHASDLRAPAVPHGRSTRPRCATRPIYAPPLSHASDLRACAVVDGRITAPLLSLTRHPRSTEDEPSSSTTAQIDVDQHRDDIDPSEAAARRHRSLLSSSGTA